MTAVRLSPAASLLRNSKLFALPPTISLPAADPTSESVANSDTATTVHPTRAAIATPLLSLNKGDWGFKRALPLKSTTKTGNTVVRLNNGIDTSEHIADFDSAADHVLTLKKFQELNQALQMPTGDPGVDSHTKRDSAFSAVGDNTTNLPSTIVGTRYTGVWPNIDPSIVIPRVPELQESIDSHSQSTSTLPSSARTPRARTALRWRFDGPSLVQLSGLEFEQYIQTLGSEKRAAFQEKVKQFMIRDKNEQAQAKARDEGTVGENHSHNLEASSTDVADYLKKLRQQPEKFGPLIAEFLDLPDGPEPGKSMFRPQSTWEYGRQTVASEYYQRAGLPRTHPSAGLSYIHSKKFAENSAFFGPQVERSPVVARAVKVRSKATSLRNIANYGLAGFIIKTPRVASSRYLMDVNGFEPTPGGQKEAVGVTEAEISEKGTLQMMAKPATEYRVKDDKAIHNSLMPSSGSGTISSANTTRRNAGQRRVFGSVSSNSATGIDYRRKSSPEVDQDLDSMLEDFVFSNRTQSASS